MPLKVCDQLASGYVGQVCQGRRIMASFNNQFTPRAIAFLPFPWYPRPPNLDNPSHAARFLTHTHADLSKLFAHSLTPRQDESHQCQASNSDNGMHPEAIPVRKLKLPWATRFPESTAPKHTPEAYAWKLFHPPTKSWTSSSSELSAVLGCRQSCSNQGVRPFSRLPRRCHVL